MLVLKTVFLSKELLTAISEVMSKVMFDYTKSILERVSFDPLLFCKELEKAIRTLLPFELEELKEWLFEYVSQKPELKQCLLIVH